MIEATMVAIYGDGKQLKNMLEKMDGQKVQNSEYGSEKHLSTWLKLVTIFTLSVLIFMKLNPATTDQNNGRGVKMAMPGTMRLTIKT